MRVAAIHRYTAEPSMRRIYGLTLSDPAKLRIQNARVRAGFESASFGASVTLGPTETSGGSGAGPEGDGGPAYPTDTDLTVTFVARAMAALAAIPCARVYVDEPTGTSVGFRASNGSTSYIWNGAAWVAAGSAWNTAAQLEAGLPSWPAFSDTLGFVVRLLTADADVRPTFYGVVCACDFDFLGATSADTDRAASQLDDLLHRVLCTQIATGPTYEGCEEFTAADGQTEIDYSPGADGFDVATTITGVTAVYDVTDDPRMQSPLDGTWDAEDQAFTLDAPLTEDHIVHVRYTFAPTVAYTGHGDHFAETYPFIALSGGDELVRDEGLALHGLPYPDEETGRVIPRPDRVSFDFRARIVAEEPAEVQSIREALRQWFSAYAPADAPGEPGGGYGRVLLSPSTGLPIEVQHLGQAAELAKRGDAHEEHVRIRVVAWPELKPGYDAPLVTSVEWI